MIHYQLVCRRDHTFDGWFRDSSAFDRQAGAGLVACPECGSVEVNRALMAPSIGRSRAIVDQTMVDQTIVDQTIVDQTGRAAAQGAGVPAVVKPAGGTEVSVGGGPEKVVMPDQMRAMLQRLRSEVEKNCEHVGDRFADEARAIHRGESAPRSIYGESTPEQAESLAEEGIEVARVPWVPRADG